MTELVPTVFTITMLKIVTLYIFTLLLNSWFLVSPLHDIFFFFLIRVTSTFLWQMLKYKMYPNTTINLSPVGTTLIILICLHCYSKYALIFGWIVHIDTNSSAFWICSSIGLSTNYKTFKRLAKLCIWKNQCKNGIFHAYLIERMLWFC